MWTMVTCCMYLYFVQQTVYKLKTVYIYMYYFICVLSRGLSPDVNSVGQL